jgi:hypothetical protein
MAAVFENAFGRPWAISCARSYRTLRDGSFEGRLARSAWKSVTSFRLLPRQTYSPIERTTVGRIEGIVVCALSRIRYRFYRGGIGLVG